MVWFPRPSHVRWHPSQTFLAFAADRCALCLVAVLCPCAQGVWLWLQVHGTIGGAVPSAVLLVLPIVACAASSSSLACGAQLRQPWLFFQLSPLMAISARCLWLVAAGTWKLAPVWIPVARSPLASSLYIRRARSLSAALACQLVARV